MCRQSATCWDWSCDLAEGPANDSRTAAGNEGNDAMSDKPTSNQETPRPPDAGCSQAIVSRVIEKCHECGAGQNDDGSMSLPRGWPFSAPCATCQKRMEDAMFELGKACRESVDRQVLEFLVS